MTAALICTMLFSMTAYASEEEVLVVNPDCEQLTAEETQELVKEAFREYYQNGELKEELASEIQMRSEVMETEQGTSEEKEFYVLTHNGKSMSFFMKTIGEPDENGKYPLYITLHGGGESPSEENDKQWIIMSDYYAESVENGIYIACRGITDTWDLHFQEDSYPLYDRLIEAMIANYDADPDRVYLLGFSAGGDGVYQVAPRLTDRFAAVNMSSGHPNGVSLLNLANCPICLQAGIRDYYSEDAERSIRAAQFEQILSGYHDDCGFGYEHCVFIHVPSGHNYNDCSDGECQVLKDPAQFAERAQAEGFLDVFLEVLEDCGLGDDVSTLSYYPEEMDADFDQGITDAVTQVLQLETVDVDANAVHYVSQFTRDCAPEQLVWDLSERAAKREKDSFYWLEAGPEANEGIITASYDAQTNTITVETYDDVNSDFAILFHPALIDVSRPVIIETPEITRTVQVNPSEEFLKASIEENGDPELACIGKITYSELVGDAQ